MKVGGLIRNRVVVSEEEQKNDAVCINSKVNITLRFLTESHYNMILKSH